MANFDIPKNGLIRQINRGDKFGELWATKGIDLYSNPGKIKVSRTLKQILGVVTGTGVPTDNRIEGAVQAILVFTNVDQDATNKYIWVITQDFSYRCSLDNDPRVFSNWERISATGGETDSTSDAVVFNNAIVTSFATDIAQHNGDSTYTDDWWTNTVSGTALTAQRPHTMNVSRSGQETLHVCDGDKVRYYNSTAGHTTLTLQPTLVANTLMSGLDYNWCGTYSTNSQNAMMYSYLIGDELPTRAYEIDGYAVLSGDIYRNTPYIVTDRGHIQAFNGASFETVASFPFAEMGVTLSGQTVGQFEFGTGLAIHPKGMRKVGDRFQINIDTTKSTGAFPADERSPSGVWEFDPETGSLHHLYSLAEVDTDYGAFRLNSSGPILPVSSDYIEILVGAGGTNDGLYMDVDETPLAYFITPEYYGDSVTQAWERIYSIQNTLLSGESILVKYRNKRDANHPTYINSVTWLNNDTFNTTETNGANINVGDEIEFVNGYRAGYIAQVTAVSESSSVYSITIDSAIGLAGEMSGIKAENWTASKEDIEQAEGETKDIGGFGTSPYVQFKVLLLGDITINRFLTKGNNKNDR